MEPSWMSLVTRFKGGRVKRPGFGRISTKPSAVQAFGRPRHECAVVTTPPTGASRRSEIGSVQTMNPGCTSSGRSPPLELEAHETTSAAPKTPPAIRRRPTCTTVWRCEPSNGSPKRERPRSISTAHRPLLVCGCRPRERAAGGPSDISSPGCRFPTVVASAQTVRRLTKAAGIASR